MHADARREPKVLPKQAPPRARAPELVAHRGNVADFPENTLPALKSALDAGIGWIELDVQLSADRVPFVIHDATLERTTRASGDLRTLTADALAGVDAGEPARFGERHLATPLPRLVQFAELLAGYPAAQAFIELKRASLQLHGRAACIERVLEALAAVSERCVFISFDERAVAMVREQTGLRIGWVLRDYDRRQLEALATLAPDFAFVNYEKLPDDKAPLLAGPWRWAVYEVGDGRRALIEHARGAALVESMAPLNVLRDLRAAVGSP